MTPTDVFRTIQLVLAPVVMITSCGIISSGILARYSAVSDRMRTMAHERLGLLFGTDDARTLAAGGKNRFAMERLREIDRQLPWLLMRHTLLRNSLQAVYLAMLVFVASMFVIGVADRTSSRVWAAAALVVFFGGQAALLAGLFWNAREVHESNRAVEYEVRRVLELSADREPTQ